MASGSSRRVFSSTLTANTPDLVLLTEGGYGVQVENITGNGPLWFTVSTQGGRCPVPTVGASVGAFSIAAVAGASQNVRHDGQFGSIVQIISSASVQYAVSVLGNQANM